MSLCMETLASAVMYIFCIGRHPMKQDRLMEQQIIDVPLIMMGDGQETESRQ